MWRTLFLPVVLSALVACGVPSPVAAQPAADVVGEVRAAYQRLDYDAAQARARAAIEGEDLRLDQRVELHTILALIAFTRNELDEARRHFGLALDLDPGLALDPLLVSPKIVDFFDEVKRDRAPRAGSTAGEAGLRYVVVRDARPEAVLRSMLLPGWGQLYTGDRTKGWVLAGLWGAAATSGTYAHLRWVDARRAYLDEQDLDRIDPRHATSDAWFKARNNLALAAAGVWLVSYVDALLDRNDPAATLARRRGLRLAPTPADGSIQLSLRLRF